MSPERRRALSSPRSLSNPPALFGMEPEEIERLAAILVSLMDWSLSEDGKAIERTIRLGSFEAAFGFICRLALVAQRMDHHPEWRQAQARVDLRLTTHAAGRVTERDVELARAINLIADEALGAAGP
jgi:4a-hydroxytetrahydrobiopterin dehydratase